VWESVRCRDSRRRTSKAAAAPGAQLPRPGVVPVQAHAAAPR
jgi:hypothetical protein